MKTSLFILLVAFAVTIGASAIAADSTQATPHKTVLKKTDHAALCNTPQGRLKKECAQSAHR
jgi:hypothetical protein